MRLFGAILVVVFGASVALAQSDSRSNFGPVTTEAKAKTDDKAKPEAKAKAGAKVKEAKTAAKAKDVKAETKPDAKAETKPEPKSKAAKKNKKDKGEAKPNAKREADKRDADKGGEAKDKSKAAAKPATTGSAAAGATPAKSSALAESYASLPLADRMTMQSDLAWGGDYSGPIDGQYSEKFADAARAYQKRHKNPVTGILSAEERTTLATAVEPRKAEVGWRLVEDPVNGARLGIPGKFATKIVQGQNGTRWSSEQGQLQIETSRIDTGATLEAIFEQQKKMPRRRIEANSIQADSFAIAGMQGLKKMKVRGIAKNGEVRVLTILYDQAMEGSIDPLVGPMTSAFVPFAASYSAAGAADAVRRKVEYGTGLVVSASGHIVTDRALIDNCNVIALPGLGNAEPVATDRGGELALLRVYGARNFTPLGLIGASSGDTVTLVGVADPQAQSGGGSVSTVSAQLGAAAETGARALQTVPPLGFSGAAAIDAEGKVVGMVVLNSPVVAGPAGAPRAAVVAAGRIRDFLETNYVAPSSGQPGVEHAKAAVTRVICVRK